MYSRIMSAAGNSFLVGLPTMAEMDDKARLLDLASHLLAHDKPLHGLVLGLTNPLRMIMFNPDGSEAMCGNGLRCLAHLFSSQGLLEKEGWIETIDGGKRVRVVGGRVAAWLGPVRDLSTHRDSIETGFALRAGRRLLHGYGVDVGNPHFVIPVAEGELDQISHWGPELTGDPAFPDGCNIELVSLEEDCPRVRIWERGVGETPSCGTGAVAVAAVVSHLRASSSPSRLVFPGGAITVEDSGAGLFAIEGKVEVEAAFNWKSGSLG